MLGRICFSRDGSVSPQHGALVTMVTSYSSVNNSGPTCCVTMFPNIVCAFAS
jgi:hypothetical protein